MTRADDEELEALRVRAYGPHADIHLDPEAVQRLRDLESDGVEPSPSAPEDLPFHDAAPVERPTAADDVVEEVSLPWFHRLATLRRSTVFVILGLIALAACLVVALILVQRVQVAPLRVDARQVARLPVDRSFEVPKLFAGPSDDPDGGTAAFQGFLGMRSVVSSGGFVAGEPCLVVFPEATVGDASPTPYAKFLNGSCATSGFPAIVQFDLDVGDLPSELHDAFPTAKALQFVYDASLREVVVFVDE